MLERTAIVSLETDLVIVDQANKRRHDYACAGSSSAATSAASVV